MEYILLAFFYISGSNIATIKYNEYDTYKALGIYSNYNTCISALHKVELKNVNLICMKKDYQ
jgi:hypothetical protein